MKYYPEEWVAVHKGELITHAPTLRVLDMRLEETGYEMSQVWTRYRDIDPPSYVL